MRELQCPVSHCYTNAAAKQTQEPHFQSKIQTPILQSMQLKGSLGHGSCQPGRGRLSIGVGAKWVMWHSLNLGLGGKSLKKGGSPQKNFFFAFSLFCLFMILGGINHQKPQGSDWATGDGKNETARGNPGRSALAQLPAKAGQEETGDWKCRLCKFSIFSCLVVFARL